MECLGRYTFLVMTSVILSGGVKMRVEHGMLREVYIFCHDFCHTFRSSMECLGRYTFALCFFFAASFTASFAAFREALSFAASFAAFRQLLCHTLCAQKQIDKNTWFWITITITIIQEQIHKSYINSTAARRSPHRFRRTCCPLPQHLQGSLAYLSSGRRPAPGSHCLGRSTAAGREPHRFQGICCPLRLHLQ
mgnify:CR=1 FL=1